MYPVSFTCFESFSWSITKVEVIEVNNWYELWSKAGAGPNHRVDNPQEYISYFNWFLYLLASPKLVHVCKG